MIDFVQVTNFVVGLLVGGIVTLAIAYPRVGRIVARVLAACALAAGVGLLVWAGEAMLNQSQLRAFGWQRLTVSQPGEALAWGVGLLVFGFAVTGVLILCGEVFHLCVFVLQLTGQ